MKAVVFDMDGVLFDTERLCMEAWMAVAEKWGLPEMEEVFPQCIGLNANDSRQVVIGAYGEDFDYPLFRKESRYIVGLASSTKEASVRSHLEMTGLSDYFSVLTTGDMVEHSKPRPDIYLLACERLGVEPGQAYAIEDSPNGIRAAHAAGLCPVMVPDMVEPDGEILRLCRIVLRDLVQVLDFLKQV